MDIKLYQIILVALAIWLEYLIVRRYAKGRFKLIELGFASVMLLVLLMSALFPDLISKRLAIFLGIENNITAVLFIGLLISFWFNFALWMQNRKIDKKMNKIIRGISIDNFFNEDNKKALEDDSKA